MDEPDGFPFQVSFQEDKYLRWRHQIANRIAITHSLHDSIEKYPDDAPEVYPRIIAAQWVFRDYVEQCLRGLHPDAPPEFLACAEEVYRRSDVDWAKRDEYVAFEKWLAERFP